MMFVLRKEHERAIAEAIYARFIRFAIGVLRRRHPEHLADKSDEAVAFRVHIWCDHARTHGFRTEKQLLRYARATLLTGGFNATTPTGPGVEWVLENQSHDSNERSAELLRAAHAAAAVRPGGH